MADEELLYIEDSKQRKLFYRFTPAAFASNFVPLIVVLHGEEAEAPHFEYKMWNVLTPLGDVAGEKSGTVWLGEKDDFYVRDLLQELIGKIAEEYECEDHIYLYGSGTGGYGAIMHGILSKANTVYARSPRIRLNEIDTQEDDLCNLLNATDTFPLFYLCDNPGTEHSTEETAYFAQACKKHGIQVDVDHCIGSADDEEQTLKEVLSMLERMTPQG